MSSTEQHPHPSNGQSGPDSVVTSGRPGRLRAWYVKRGTAVLATAAVLVIIISATIGIEVSHALSAPDSTTPTTGAVSGAAPPTTVQPATGSPSNVPSGPSQVAAPIVPVPGGSTPGHGAFNAVACTTTSDCLAVGADATGAAVVATSVNSGSTWSDRSLPGGSSTLDAVSCGDSNHCVAVGKGMILSSADAGTSWKAAAPPIENTTLLGVSCSGPSACVAAGVSPEPGQAFAGHVVKTTDGGATWTAATMPPGTQALGGVACPTSTFCVAVGGSLMVSNDGGVTWSTRTLATGTGSSPLRSVSCTSASHCVAVGANVLGVNDPSLPGEAVVTNDGGATWVSATMPANTAAADQITCTPGSQCFAGGSGETRASAASFAGSGDGGMSWSQSSAPSGFSQVAGMACPATNHCVVVGRAGRQPVTSTTKDGSSWAVTSVPQS